VRFIALPVVAITLACAPRPTPTVAPRITPSQLASRLADADRLASRGCYLCLKEAAAVYADLLALSDDPAVARKALENTLMIALREAELRIPDSGARATAEELQTRVRASYAAYFTVLDSVARPEPTNPRTYELANPTNATNPTNPTNPTNLANLLSSLEPDWPASAMKTYFYLAVLLRARPFKDIQTHVESVVTAHADDLSIKYRLLTFQPTYSGEEARALIGMETGFGEVHYLLGQRAVMGGNLASAFRDLTRARELLSDSAAITLALANVTFSYARYADSLVLFDRVVANPAGADLDRLAQLGRAKALSYLKRHGEAVGLLDDLLLADARNNPGEKYYWRAWNKLQMGQSQQAYEDATTGLNAMRNDAIYRLAGIASFNLSRTDESRKFFEGALQMNRGDCDSVRYLGLLDSAAGSWKPAVGRFSDAAACYDAVIARMRTELAEYEQDITGLSNGLIVAKRAEIAEAGALRAQSAQNASAASKNAGPSK
jgi:tetratricopeptide (TPR) repeat protein